MPVPVVVEGAKQPVWCYTYVHQADQVIESAPSALYLRTILDGYAWAGVQASPKLLRLLDEVSAHGQDA